MQVLNPGCWMDIPWSLEAPPGTPPSPSHLVAPAHTCRSGPSPAPQQGHAAPAVLHREAPGCAVGTVGPASGARVPPSRSPSAKWKQVAAAAYGRPPLWRTRRPSPAACSAGRSRATAPCGPSPRTPGSLAPCRRRTYCPATAAAPTPPSGRTWSSGCRSPGRRWCDSLDPVGRPPGSRRRRPHRQPPDACPCALPVQVLVDAMEADQPIIYGALTHLVPEEPFLPCRRVVSPTSRPAAATGRHAAAPRPPGAHSHALWLTRTRLAPGDTSQPAV